MLAERCPTNALLEARSSIAPSLKRVRGPLPCNLVRVEDANRQGEDDDWREYRKGVGSHDSEVKHTGLNVLRSNLRLHSTVYLGSIPSSLSISSSATDSDRFP